MIINLTAGPALGRAAMSVLTGGEFRILGLDTGPRIDGRSRRASLEAAFEVLRSPIWGDDPALDDTDWLRLLAGRRPIRARSSTFRDWRDRFQHDNPPVVAPMFRPVTLARFDSLGVVQRLVFLIHVSGPHFVPRTLLKLQTTWSGLLSNGEPVLK